IFLGLLFLQGYFRAFLILQDTVRSHGWAVFQILLILRSVWDWFILLPGFSGWVFSFNPKSMRLSDACAGQAG
ncbi:hypothetical protein, partial [Gluconobacter sp.]|uniref:hypothetical protein n=1 Tax=Gluconobacter sp. TaxID=1876758 RepID=UPI0039ECCE33